MTRVFISCGEATGDLYAARAGRGAAPPRAGRRDRRLRRPAAGRRRRDALRGLSPTTAVTASSRSSSMLPRTWRLLSALVAAARRTPARRLRRNRLPRLQFHASPSLQRGSAFRSSTTSAPQLWAWRAGRMRHDAPLRRRWCCRSFRSSRRSTRRPACPSSSSVIRWSISVAVRADRAALLRAHRPRPGAAGAGAAAGQPATTRSTRSCPTWCTRAAAPAERVPGVQFVVARAPSLEDALFAPLDAAPATRRSLVTMVEARADDVLVGGGRGGHRVGHGDRADRAAREADGDRLPGVRAELCARPALREGGHVRHGQPHRRAQGARPS